MIQDPYFVVLVAETTWTGGVFEKVGGAIVNGSSYNSENYA